MGYEIKERTVREFDAWMWGYDLEDLGDKGPDDSYEFWIKEEKPDTGAAVDKWRRVKITIES